MSKEGLTFKQQAFVAEYIKDKNAVQAAIRAGYSKRTASKQGSQLIAKTRIKSAIMDLLQKATDKSVVDKSWLLNESADLYEECRKAGDRTNAKGMLDLIGKHCDVNAFKDNIEVTGPAGGAIQHKHTVELKEYEQALKKILGAIQ